MRILRGKSNLEVSSHGFALFVVGLILATFFGGAARTLLRSDRVHQRIVGELKSRFPKVEIKVGSTEVLLSRGLWPALGLKMSGLSVNKETCGRLGFQLEVPEAILPVSMWGFRSGHLQLGDAELAGGRLHLKREPCPPTGKAESQSARSSPSSSPTSWTPPRLEWQGLRQVIRGISLKDFAVTYEDEPTWKVVVDRATVEFGHEFSAIARIDVQKSLPFGGLNHVIDLDVHTEDQVLEWLVSSSFKEGRVVWKGSWDMSTHAAMSSMDVRQFPIKDVLTELYLVGLLDQDVEMRTTWVSCSASWDGSLAQPGEMPVRLRGCKVEGAYGAVQMDQAEVFPLQTERLKVPVELRVQSLQLQPLAEAFDIKLLPTVFTRLGVWSGSARFLNSESWTLEGNLDNLEVAFSNQSVRGKQMIRRIKTEVERSGATTGLKINHIDLPDGQFIGAVEMNFSHGVRLGQFKAHVDNLVLSPAVQNILVGGRWEALKFHGAGELRDGEMKAWTGVFESSTFGGVGWSAEGMVLNTRYTPGVFAIDGRLSAVTLRPEWRYYALVRDHIFPKSDLITWRNIKSKIEVHKSGGQIKSLAAQEEGGARSWRGYGAWERDGELVLALTGGGGKLRSLKVRTEKGLLSVDEQPGLTR